MAYTHRLYLDTLPYKKLYSSEACPTKESEHTSGDRGRSPCHYANTRMDIQTAPTLRTKNQICLCSTQARTQNARPIYMSTFKTRQPYGTGTFDKANATTRSSRAHVARSNQSASCRYLTPKARQPTRATLKVNARAGYKAL